MHSKTRERIAPFLKILNLAAGDFVAKTLNFLTFVFLARILGVASYGILEFALSASLYFLMIADAGVEWWATREAAKGEELRVIAARVLSLRIILAIGSFVLLLLVIPFFSGYPNLPRLLLVFGLGCFTQAFSLKWAVLGSHQMGQVSKGLVLMQLVFAVFVVGFVRSPQQIIWVPVFRIMGDLVMVFYFWILFRNHYGSFSLKFFAAGTTDILRPSIVLGATLLLSLMNYNLDSVLLGFMVGAKAVGVYNAAYKPVTVALAMPVTYFIGLFPILSRAYATSEQEFQEIVNQSFEFTAIFAIPIAIGGFFLARPLILFLFGEDYAASVPVLQILIWSASLATLRGTFKHGLVAAGKQRVDLLTAVLAALTNVVLNLALIPRYGPPGAAAATLSSEFLWILLSSHYFHRDVIGTRMFPHLLRPLVAGTLMGGVLYVIPFLNWVARGFLAIVVYSASLYVLLRLRSKISPS